MIYRLSFPQKCSKSVYYYSCQAIVKLPDANVLIQHNADILRSIDAIYCIQKI